jgi:DNA-binding MarR family transcriptional regulator
VRLLHLTDGGHELLQQATPPLQRVQDRLLAPLTAAQHQQLMSLFNPRDVGSRAVHATQHQQLMGLLNTLLQGHQDAPADD